MEQEKLTWKEEENRTCIAKMHVGLANATAQTRGGRGEQRRTSVVWQITTIKFPEDM
jgi:hypothetical protein